MSEFQSVREQILRHIELVDATGIEPPAEWQELRQRWEAFDRIASQPKRGKP